MSQQVSLTCACSRRCIKSGGCVNVTLLFAKGRLEFKGSKNGLGYHWDTI